MLSRTAALASAATLTAVLALAHGNPREELKATLGKGTVTVEYGRPSLKGRDMLGQAEVGTVWRVGADKSATLTTDTALAFGDQSVPAGSYVLKARKTAEDQWHLLLEADGTAAVEIPLSGRALDESVELFTIALAAEGQSGTLELHWGTLALATGFRAA